MQKPIRAERFNKGQKSEPCRHKVAVLGQQSPRTEQYSARTAHRTRIAPHIAQLSHRSPHSTPHRNTQSPDAARRKALTPHIAVLALYIEQSSHHSRTVLTTQPAQSSHIKQHSSRTTTHRTVITAALSQTSQWTVLRVVRERHSARRDTRWQVMAVTV